jgi:hypothetical protein
MEAPDLTPTEHNFLLAQTVPGEVAAIELDDDAFDLTLRGLEVRAMAGFVQLHGKVCHLRDGMTPTRFVGRVFIEHINGADDFDVDDLDSWRDLTIDNIAISVKSVCTWGERAKKYSALRQIKEISRFAEQP